MPHRILLALTFLLAHSVIAQPDVPPRVETAYGTLEGAEDSGINVFRGVPFAAPPVGDLRWKAPQPVEAWDGVRKADKFGPQAMQRPFFSDMVFRSDGMSEDCLYLNIWTPAVSGDERLPVLVYFYGGGLFTGDGSEPRYAGASMARRGIVSITVNYRLNIFGFFAHPELTEEAPYKASGNYGFLDQTAALEWIEENIAAFGGDPDRVTIAGESAGSVSVSAQMASPLSKHLIAGAIGSSGSLIGTLRAGPLADVEKKGVEFAEMVGAESLAELRAMSAEELLKATEKISPVHFSPAIDGYFFPKTPREIFEAGEQSHVPLLLGWNSQEGNYRGILADKEPTLENYTARVQEIYGEQADDMLEVYAPSTDEEVIQVATDLAGDRFTGFSTWKWADVHAKTGHRPVYRYLYARPRPAMRDPESDAPPATGAVHSAEIEYAMGNLPTNRVYDWTPDDYKVSAIFQSYYANFVKTGNPNGFGVPMWPALDSDGAGKIMHIDVHTRLEPQRHAARYRMLDRLRN